MLVYLGNFWEFQNKNEEEELLMLVIIKNVLIYTYLDDFCFVILLMSTCLASVAKLFEQSSNEVFQFFCIWNWSDRLGLCKYKF